jgi:hypothetical protein
VRRIGFVLDMRLHARAVVGLAGHVEDIALDIEFPAVIEAAQTAFLVAPESERGLAMRAMLAEDAEPTLCIAEDDQVLAQEPCPHWRPVGLGDFFRQAGGQPMAAHQRAHRRCPLDPAQELVFFRRHANLQRIT